MEYELDLKSPRTRKAMLTLGLTIKDLKKKYF